MNHEHLIERLRAEGHRLTPQRRLALEVLQQNNHHLSAEEIAQQIAKRYPSIKIDIATIYRTLKWLQNAGVVSETSLGQNRMVYVLVGQHDHHHLVCSQCNAAIEADPAIFDAVRDELLRRYGFAARLEHLALFGLCAHCREASNNGDGT